MAVTIDIGDKKEHPKNKHDTGIRLARWALHNDFGRKDLVPSGPLYTSIKIEGRTIRVLFDHAQNGLMLAGKEGVQSNMQGHSAKSTLPYMAEDPKTKALYDKIPDAEGKRFGDRGGVDAWCHA